MSKVKVTKGSLTVTFINSKTGRKEVATVSTRQQNEFWRRQRRGEISIISATKKRN